MHQVHHLTLVNFAQYSSQLETSLITLCTRSQLESLQLTSVTLVHGSIGFLLHLFRYDNAKTHRHLQLKRLRLDAIKTFASSMDAVHLIDIEQVETIEPSPLEHFVWRESVMMPSHLCWSCLLSFLGVTCNIYTFVFCSNFFRLHWAICIGSNSSLFWNVPFSINFSGVKHFSIICPTDSRCSVVASDQYLCDHVTLLITGHSNQCESHWSRPVWVCRSQRQWTCHVSSRRLHYISHFWLMLREFSCTSTLSIHAGHLSKTQVSTGRSCTDLVTQFVSRRPQDVCTQKSLSPVICWILPPSDDAGLSPYEFP